MPDPSQGAHITIPDWMYDTDDPVAKQITHAITIADEVLSGNVENLEEARDEMVRILTTDSTKG